MSAKSFLCVAAGVFLLVAAYTLGARRVQGQVSATNRVVGITNATTAMGGGDVLVAITENGDCYYQVGYTQASGAWWPNTQWVRGGNIGTGTIAVEGSSWSATKGVFRK